MTRASTSSLIAVATAVTPPLRPALGNAVVVSPHGIQADSVEAWASTGHRIHHESAASGPVRQQHGQAAAARATRIVDQAIAGIVTHHRSSRFGPSHKLDLDGDLL